MPVLYDDGFSHPAAVWMFTFGGLLDGLKDVLEQVSVVVRSLILQNGQDTLEAHTSVDVFAWMHVQSHFAIMSGSIVLHEHDVPHLPQGGSARCVSAVEAARFITTFEQLKNVRRIEEIRRHEVSRESCTVVAYMKNFELQ